MDVNFQTEKECFDNCESSADFKKYLKRYRNGVYADIAKSIVRKRRRRVFWAWMTPIIAILIFVFFHNYQPKSVNSSKPVEPIKKESIVSHKPEPKTKTPTEYELWGNNQLSTGSCPYYSHFGSGTKGDNWLYFKTSGDNDYVVIVKGAYSGRYFNHIYIQGGDTATIYLPDGDYYVYFYSGKGWNPDKQMGDVTGGFVSNEYKQKDGPISLYSAYIEYTLYPVTHGNLQLQKSNNAEMF